jgi:hypothetical protein
MVYSEMHTHTRERGYVIFRVNFGAKFTLKIMYVL